MKLIIKINNNDYENLLMHIIDDGEKIKIKRYNNTITITNLDDKEIITSYIIGSNLNTAKIYHLKPMDMNGLVGVVNNKNEIVLYLQCEEYDWSSLDLLRIINLKRNSDRNNIYKRLVFRR